ncbi:hypothetical protein FC40_GL000019 [Ligilactobacillus hayakitensis DSM 18933 = JCM 14209]|uniref:Uncharacterized protein n=2 Tax=Ligilactobacillus TaxID=2767887 RepID=A0A0R1WNM1_9LACO|nr:hypothetical protein FC40_GL000019 [Ligilactobacillus hayakitensis DSM 18933 = JCM 14209]
MPFFAIIKDIKILNEVKKMNEEQLIQRIQYQSQLQVTELQEVLNKLNGLSTLLNKAMKNGVVVNKQAYNEFADKYNDLVRSVDGDLQRAKIKQAKNMDLLKKD